MANTFKHSIYTYSLDSSHVKAAIRDHPDYEGDQKPGQRWFEQSRESRVTGWNRAKKTKVLSTGCIGSSVVTNVRQRANHRIREVENHIRRRNNHDQGVLVLLSVIFMAAGGKAKLKVPVHLIGLRYHVLHLGEAMLPTPCGLTSQPGMKI